MIAFYNELLSLSKALSLAPENYSVLFYLGRCYSRLDLYDKALCCATDLQGKGVVRNDGVLFLCKKAIGPHQDSLLTADRFNMFDSY